MLFKILSIHSLRKFLEPQVALTEAVQETHGPDDEHSTPQNHGNQDDKTAAN